MGKGRSSGRFYKFIDESYFGYQFWIWGLILSLVGIGMIIAGVVVYQTMPAAREAEIIASAKLADGDTESLTYTSWQSIVQTVSFTFKNIDASAATPSCSKVGPYVYAFTTTKASLVFSADGTKVSYSIQSNKAFSTTASVAIQNVRLVDPQYAALIEGAGGENEFFWDLFTDHGNYSNTLTSFIKTDMPALLGSRAYSRSFPAKYKAARKGVLDNAVFGDALQGAVDVYPYYYANTLLRSYCPSGVVTSTCGYQNMLFWFTNDANCRMGLDSTADSFFGAMANAWNGVTSSVCTDFFRARALDPAAGFTTAEAQEAIRSNLTLWYNEFDTGACQATTRAPVTIDGETLNVAKVNSFCDNFLPKWFADTVPSGDTFADLGKKKLCVGAITNIASNFGSSHPSFRIFSLPSNVQDQMPALNISRATYDAQECGKILTALTNLNDFVAPILDGETVTLDHQLSAADLTLATNFINTHKATQKWLFTHYVTSPAGSNPIDTCPGCAFKSMHSYGLDVSSFSNANTFKSFINNFFPDMTPAGDPQKTIRDRHASTVMDPKPVILTGGIFGTWQSTTPGALGFLRNTIPSAAFNALGLDATTAPYMKTYITKVAEGILAAEYGKSTLLDIAYEHFASGGAMFGTDCTTVTQACSVAHEFFDFDENYYIEYGVARALGPFTFTNSFGGPGALDPILDYNSVDLMLTLLFSSEYKDLAIGTGIAYFHYFAPTFIRSRFFRPSDGILPLRAASVWIDSAADNSSLVAQFGGPNVAFHVTSPYPPPNARTYTIYTGTDDGAKSFKFSAIDGLAQAVSANGNVAIDGLYNADQFPPAAVKAGETIKIFDPVLERALAATVGDEELVESLTGNAIVMEKLPWALRTVVDDVSGAALVACGTVSGAPTDFTCGDAADDNVDSKVVVSLNSGKVLLEQHCYQSVVAIGNVTFPVTAPNLAKDTFYSQAQIKYSRAISSAAADEFAAQFNEAEQLASNIRAALCAVGAFFLVVGLVFVVFAIMRRIRKQHKKAETELVEDPFKENQRTGFTR